MSNFIVIEKDSLNKSTVNATKITLTEASIVHTKMHRDDVAEFLRDGNNLVLKLKNGEVVVLENFFAVDAEGVTSDLVFEEDGCVLYWFDGVSSFKGIPGLEVLLPEAGSKLGALLPWLVGAGVVGGIIAATDDDNKDRVDGAITAEIDPKAGTVSGTVTDVPEGEKVIVTIEGVDKDGNPVKEDVETTVVDGKYTVDIPAAIVDGSPVDAEAKSTDNNGKPVTDTATLEGKTNHDNDPNTPDQGGLDRVDGAITAEIDPKAGTVSGTVTDVPEGEKVIVTIEGVDKDGNPVKEDVETTVVDGKYTVDIPAAIVDGSPVDAEAKSTDNNGKPVTDTATLEGKTNHDNDPNTPDQGGLDRVDGAITVDIVESGKITGTTQDVAPNTDVVLTITGKDVDGNDVTITKTVKTDASGHYSYQLTGADVDPVSGKPLVDGSAVNVEANTTDRNGKPVGPATDGILAQGDNDTDPSTPEDTGLDLVKGEITVDIVESGKITGTTQDVAPNTDVVLTITGKDVDGNDVTITKTVKTDANGNYDYQLTGADVDPVSGKPLVDGSAVNVEANTTDRNGKPVGPATDGILAQGDNDTDPSTPEDTGLDLVKGEITVDIVESGKITGTTQDVAPNTDVVLTITGKDVDGNDVTITKTVKTDASGHYSYQLTGADVDPVSGKPLVDGSAVNVEANTTDRNGKPVGPATDGILAQGDNDTDPSTPEDTGLDLVKGEITVDIVESGKITGTTQDVAPNTDVVLTITGKDVDGNDVTITKTVKTDANGNYDYQLTGADVDPVSGKPLVDGSAVNVEANTTDRNGKPVGPATDGILAQGDNDTDPSTPEDTGLDLVKGEITVDIVESGKITGTTQDVAPNTDVVLTITGKDVDGNDVTITKTVKTDASGHYSYQLTGADVDPVSGKPLVDGSALNVEANTTDRNGKPVGPATDGILAQGDNDTDPDTPEDTGLDLVKGEITVDIVESGKITGTTQDVAPNTDVVLTITGKDVDGNDVTITKTVKTDASGHYSYQLTGADVDPVSGKPLVDGSAVNVEANTTDRNGKPVGPATDGILAQGDNDTDPDTPEDTGLDLVKGEITVDIVDNDSTQIKGTTTDVPPNSTVTLTIKTSIDDNGETREFTTTVETDNDGNYSYTLTPEQGNATEVVAQVTDRNGVQREDTDQSDAVIKTDPTTDVDNGDNTVIGAGGDDLIAGDTGGLKTNFEAGHNYNVSIILDLSGSMAWAMDGGRSPAPGESRLDIAKKGLKAFIQQMIDHDGVINLQLVTFSVSGAEQGKYTVSESNKQAIFDEIDTWTAGGGTAPHTGFPIATNWFNSQSNGYENQTYFLADGEFTNSTTTQLNTNFSPLAAVSKVYSAGISTSVTSETMSKYDNTLANGEKISGTWNATSNFGEAQALGTADKLIAYLIGGSENFIPADVGNDIVKGGAGNDILFGDAMNTDWITGLDPLLYPKYSGYSKLIAHLKADVTGGAEPTQQQIYDFVKDNYQKFIDADTADAATKGGNDTIYGGSGNDIIIAGAGDDRIYGGSGDDIISTGRGDDTIVFDVLNAADATGGNGTDTWVDYEANDKIEFGADFFESLLADKSNISEYIKVEDVNGKAVLKVDRDGAADATGGTTHDWADLLIIEGKTASELQDLINEQIYIG